ncbi:MAG: pilus assembly protein PilW [Pseudomonadales bacterium]|nr:pilus assembly protein PilW [Pseudomonadales bacterium]
MTKSLHIKNQVGLSLIELLIAMVLGLTLATGVIQIYVGSSTTERDQDARLRMQENGRFAMNFLSNEIRMAGYLGCLGSIEGNVANNLLTDADGADDDFQPEFGVQGWEAGGTDPGTVNNSQNNVAVVGTFGNGEWTTSDPDPGAPDFVIPDVNATPNSDILRLWGTQGNPGAVLSVVNNAPGTADVITADSAVGIQEDEFLIISDCEQVDVVQACTVVNAGLVATITLDATCAPGNAVATSVITSAVPAEVIRLQGTLFYVGKRDDTATNSPSLFMATLDDDGTLAAPQEVIEGVESMQLLYGVNVDQDVRATVDAYLTADNVTDWDEVISIRISLLMQSVENGTVPVPQAYTFDGVVYDGAGGGNGALPADDRVRRDFVNTISLRNRALGT